MKGKNNKGYMSPNQLRLSNHGNQLDESDDSNDSDKRELFKLPARKIVRPPASHLRKKVGLPNICLRIAKKCVNACTQTVFPFVISVFIVATTIAVGYVLMGVNGMKGELNQLRAQLRDIESADHNNLQRNQQLFDETSDKLNQIQSHKEYINKLHYQIKYLRSKVYHLNATIRMTKVQVRKYHGKVLSKLVEDVESLKTGMAKSGANADMWKDSNKILTHAVNVLKGEMENTKKDIFNMSVTISRIEHKPAPTNSPVPVVVTLTPGEDLTPYTKKEMDQILSETYKQIDKKADANFHRLAKALNQVRNLTTTLNQTCLEEFYILKATNRHKASQANHTLTTKAPVVVRILFFNVVIVFLKHADLLLSF